MGIKCIILDHTVITSLPDDELRSLIVWIKENELCWAAFSTHSNDMDGMELYLKLANIPLPDYTLTKDDVGKNKGGIEWIEKLKALTRLDSSEMVYVGDDNRDWHTALNSGVAYLHAGWSTMDPKKVNIPRAVVLQNISDLKIFIEHFFLREPLWSYRLDDEEEKVHVRCLLDANSYFSADNGTFTLKSIFTYNNTSFTVGGMHVHHLLLLHTMSNLYLEGIMSSSTYFCKYPSHDPNNVNPILSDFFRFAVAVFKQSYYREDWLVRHTRAPDTSMLRHERGQASITHQANTVVLAAKSKRSLKKSPTVIVIDDFTTEGFSFEWARNLLYSAGAGRVVLVALGKYRRSHKVHVPSVSVDPFKPGKYEADDFSMNEVRLEYNADVEDRIRILLDEWKAKKPSVQLIEFRGP